MARIEALDPDRHRTLRVSRPDETVAKFQGHIVPVLANELGKAALDYPICLVKNPEDGEFSMFAMLGLWQGENLFAGSHASDVAPYAPLHIKHQPFGVLRRSSDGAGAVAVNLDHPLVSETEGIPVFDRENGESSLLDELRPTLQEVVDGIASTSALIQALQANDLISQGRIDVPSPDGGHSLDGFYTINADVLRALSGEVLAQLNAQGFLFAAHLMLASMGNVPKLLAMRQKK